jgi:outer membrane protein TolC
MLETRMARLRFASFLLVGLALELSVSPIARAQDKGVTPPPPPKSLPAGANADREARNIADERVARILPTPGGWTADQAAKRAHATSYDVAAKTEALRAAAARVDQAVVGFFPRLALLGKYTHLSPLPTTGATTDLIVPSNPTTGPVTDPTMMNRPTQTLLSVPLSFPVPQENYLLQATVTVPLSDYVLKLSQAHSAASHNETSAKMDRIAAEAKAESDARIAFYNWVKALGQREVLSLALDAAVEHQKDADNLFRAGQGNKADALAAEANVAAGRLSLEQAVEMVGVAEEQLRALTHAAEGEQITLGEDVTGAMPAHAMDLAALRQEALANRPDLLSLTEGEISTEKNAAAIGSAQYPNLSAFADGVYANPNQRIFPLTPKFYGTWDVGLQVTWSPNDTFTAHGQAAEADANAARLKAQQMLARDNVLVEVAQAVLAAKTADVSAETTVSQLTSAEEAYRQRKELFHVGKGTSVELTDAESALFRARLAAVSARIDQRIAKVKLDHAVGRDAQAATGQPR